jgi:hypothetical protein
LRKLLPIILFAAAASLAGPLFSQDAANETAPPADEAGFEDDGAAVYVIRGFVYHIKGMTRASAITYNVELEEGQRIEGWNAFEAYIARKNQMLKNQRVLESNKCYIEYTLGDPEEDGAIPVYLDIYAEDSWNIIALPEPKFDSNTGLSLTVKARDYNFLGTMSALRFNIGYELETGGDNSFNFLIDSDIPFNAFGLHWKVNFDNELDYTVDKPLYYKNTTGLSMELPWRTTTFTFGINQSFIINEENSDDEKNYWAGKGFTGIAKDYFTDWYMAAEFSASWKIPTGLEAWNYGSIDYAPTITQTFRYHPGTPLSYWRESTLSFGHSLGFSRIDWKGNFRSGLGASLSNGYSLSERSLRWNNNIGLSATWHHRFSRRFGISARAQYTYWFGDPHTSAGDVIRGLHNDQLAAQQRIAVNLEFPFRLIRFVPSEWVRRKWIRIFDFEMHTSPFIDIGMADDPLRPEYSFKPSGIVTGMGLELIVFPLRWRSLFLRISAGWDMREWLRINRPPGGYHRELFIGVGHFY